MRNDFVELDKFVPRRLEEALNIVRENHSLIGEIEAAADPSLLEALKKILKQTPYSDLESLARKLKPVQVRCCLEIICHENNEEIVKKAESIIDLRPRKDLLRPAWNLLIWNYPVERIERITRTLGEKYGWSSISANFYRVMKINKWFKSQSLYWQILQDFLISEDNDFNEWMNNHGFKPKMGIFEAVLIGLVFNFSKETINRIGHIYLWENAKERSDITQRKFAIRYLNILRSADNWNPKIIDWISSKHGKPGKDKSTLSTFWQAVDAQVRSEFRRAVIEKTLEEFFQDIRDPHFRFQFWKGYSKYIHDVKRPSGCDVVLMDFNGFGVIEFAEKGNAAYVYPAPAFKEMWNIANRKYLYPYALKNQNKTLKDPGFLWDGRIIHRGDWRGRFKPIINTLIKRMGSQ